ncbi:SGNH/GDSL hydrolase family protein [Rhizobium panacihumi]|uniref:SGNH/GDSL hydrolase family protein n=1 Tax=Rhizobium panacihumi TaxID=2008450 RepID=UPI003D7B24BF
MDMEQDHNHGQNEPHEIEHIEPHLQPLAFFLYAPVDTFFPEKKRLPIIFMKKSYPSAVLICVLTTILACKASNALEEKQFTSMVLHPAHAVDMLNINNKTEVDCASVATQKPFVLLGVGQSLMANSNGDPEWSKVSYKRVYEQWAGKCYEANSPLFGAGDGAKSFMLPMANLIARGKNRAVLINMAAVGGMSSKFFTPGNPGADLIVYQIENLTKLGLKPDAVLFQQGQADVALGTPAEEYFANYSAIFRNLKAHGVAAPNFVAVDTMVTWATYPKTAEIQRRIALMPNAIPGPNIDLITYRKDGTHLDNAGVELQAAMWFQALAAYFGW